jgi:hypothetical protein
MPYVSLLNGKVMMIGEEVHTISESKEAHFEKRNILSVQTLLRDLRF